MGLERDLYWYAHDLFDLDVGDGLHRQFELLLEQHRGLRRDPDALHSAVDQQLHETERLFPQHELKPARDTRSGGYAGARFREFRDRALLAASSRGR